MIYFDEAFVFDPFLRMESDRSVKMYLQHEHCPVVQRIQGVGREIFYFEARNLKLETQQV
jgi:hypothetical protein